MEGSQSHPMQTANSRRGSSDDLDAPSSSSEARLLDGVAWEKAATSPQHSRSPTFCRRHCITILNFCLFIISCTLFTLSFSSPERSNNWLLQQTSFYCKTILQVQMDTIAETLTTNSSHILPLRHRLPAKDCRRTTL